MADALAQLLEPPEPLEPPELPEPLALVPVDGALDEDVLELEALLDDEPDDSDLALPPAGLW